MAKVQQLHTANRSGSVHESMVSGGGIWRGSMGRVGEGGCRHSHE